jgi:hypothetical protein
VVYVVLLRIGYMVSRGPRRSAPRRNATHGVSPAFASRIRVYQSYIDWQESPRCMKSARHRKGLGDGPRWREFRLAPDATGTVVDLAEERWTATAVMVFVLTLIENDQCCSSKVTTLACSG